MEFKKIELKHPRNCVLCGQKIGLENAIILTFNNQKNIIDELDILESFHYNCFIKSVIKEIPEIKIVNRKKRMQILLENI